MGGVLPEANSTSVTTSPRNQSFIQKPVFIAPLDCFHCFFGRCPCNRASAFYAIRQARFPAVPMRSRGAAMRRRAARMDRIGLALFIESRRSTPNLTPFRQVTEETG